MTSKHHTNFQKCSNSYEERKRNPLCILGERPFSMQDFIYKPKADPILPKPMPSPSEPPSKPPFKPPSKPSFKPPSKPPPNQPSEPDSNPDSNPYEPGIKSGMRPLKKMTKLTQSELDRGKMVGLAYEIDHHINEEVHQRGHDPFGTDEQVINEVTDDLLMQHGEDFLNNFGLEEYKIMNNLSTKQYIILEKGNDLKIVFRGRAGSNPIDNTHVLDTIKGKSRDYTELDTLMEDVRAYRPNANVEVVSYSNGGPKGFYMANRYNLPHYSIDPVVGPQEIRMLANRSRTAAPLKIARTNLPALASGVGQTAIETLTGRLPHNTEILNVAPIKGTRGPMGAHALDHFSENVEDAPRQKVGPLGRNMAGSIATGIIPAALATYTVEQVTPDAPEEGKLAESAALASAATKFVSPILGAGAAAMSETLLPMYASFQAADKAGKAVHTVLPSDLDGLPSSVIEGATSGGAGGLAFGATAMAQQAAVQAATGYFSTAGTAAAATEGIELAAVGGEALLATEGVLEAAAAGAAVGGASTIELGPLAAGGVALGALIGLTAYLAGGGGGSQESHSDLVAAIDPQEIQRRMQRARDRDNQMRGVHARMEAQSLASLLALPYDRKRQEHIDAYRQQRRDGTLPSHLEEVFRHDENSRLSEPIRQRVEAEQLYTTLSHFRAADRERLAPLLQQRAEGSLPKHLEAIFQQFEQ